MKIQCEHCGAMIDIDKDKKCTNCGAPYKNNKEYEKVKDLKYRNEEADVQRKEYQNEMMKKAPKTIGKIMLIPFLVFIVALISMIVIFVVFAKRSGTLFNQINTTEKEKTNIKEVTVSFNELASTDAFDIICDEVHIYDPVIPNSNTNAIGLHVIVKNKSDSILQLYNMKLTYTDDKGNTGIVAKNGMLNFDDGFNYLNLYVEKGYAGSGFIAFETPKYVNDAELHFNNVTIKINDIDQIKK